MLQEQAYYVPSFFALIVKVKIGFIGCGGIARLHADILSKFEDVDFRAFSDIDKNKAEAFAARYGGRAYGDYREMLEKEELDACFICIPPYAHVDQEILCAERGIHIFVEKPVALTLEKAVEILNTVRRAGVITQVGYVRRFAESYVKARSILLERGGRVGLFEAWWIGGVAGGPDHWWRRRELSGGQLVEQTTHLVDLARWMVNNEVAKVSAFFEEELLRDLPNFNIESASAVIMQFKSGAVASITSTCAAQPKGMSVGFRATARNLQVMSGLGWWSVVVVEGEKSEVLEVSTDPYTVQDRHFIDCVKAGRESEVPYIEGVKALEITLAAVESARTGQPVRLPMTVY